MSGDEQSTFDSVISNFDVALYATCEKWGIQEWTLAIQHRLVLEAVLEHRARIGGSSAEPGFDQLVSALLRPIRRHPTDLTYVNQELTYVAPTIRDMTVSDLASFEADYRAAQIPDFWESAEDAVVDEQSSPCNIDDLSLDHILYRPTDDQVAIVVDLKKTDDDIVKEFKCWLKQKRNKAKPKVGQKKWARFDEGHLAKWHRYQLLACIDLKLQVKAIDELEQLTEKIICNTIFPDTKLDQQDQIDRIQSTILPWIDRVLNYRTLSALVTQANR